MFSNMMLKAWILFSLVPFAASAQPADRPLSETKLYCVVIANQKGRTPDFHFYVRACPASGDACFTERKHRILRNKGGRSTQGSVACSVQRSPVNFELTFDGSERDGYQERLEVLKPQVFDWRGLAPNIWCVGKAWFHFTNEKAGAGLAAGYPRRTQRGSCEWEDARDISTVSAETGLPAALIGSWVPKGKECPGFFDEASRTGDVLWVQPHAVERSSGACLLTGLFPLTPTLPVDTLCQTAKGNKRTTFTFDRIGGDTMRLREGRGRRVTYRNCKKTWLPSPEQRETAAKLKGQTLSFILEIDARMLGVQSGKTIDGSHTRKIELRVGDDGRLIDRMQIGDATAPKTFTTRFGEIAVDTDGDRATWRVEDGKLKRVRERKGYYEILSWPLNFDSRSVKCEAEMKLVSTRSDGRLRTVGTDKLEYDIINAGIKSQRCPTGLMSFVVAAKKERPAATVPDKQTPVDDKCIIPTVDRVKDSARIRYKLTLRNQCPVNLIVRVDSENTVGLIIADLPGSSGRFQIGRSFGLTAAREASPKEFLEVLKFSVLTADDYNKSCPGIDVENTDKALACFGKAYVAKHGEPDWVKDAKAAGGCAATNPDIAIKACTAQIEAGKADANTLNRRALSYMDKGQYDLALSDLNKAISDNPKDDTSWNNRGVVRMKKKEYRRAIEDFSKAIELTTIEELRPYRQRAEAYAALGQYEEAIKDADEALKIDPDDKKAQAIREASMKKRKAKSNETDAKPQRFDIYEKIHIRHILLNSETDAELVAKLLKGGADFAQTAKSLSIDKATASKGGDLGWVGIGTLVKEFEDAAFALEPGDISGPVKTQFGWHIIKLEEARSQ